MTNTPLLDEAAKKRAIKLIFISIFIDFLGLGMVIPIFTPLLKDVGQSILPIATSDMERNVLYGILFAANSFGQFLGAPVLGAYSDRIGRKKLLLFTIAINLVMFSVCAVGIYIKFLAILMVSRFIAGMLGSSIPIVQSAFSDVSSDEEKAKNFGLVGAAFGLGVIIGAALGHLLSNPSIIPWFNLGTPFVFVGVVNLINFAFVWKYFPQTLQTPNLSPINPLKGFQNIKRAFVDPKLNLVYLTIFLITFGFSYFLQFMPIHLTDKFDYGKGGITAFVAVFGIYVGISQGLVLPFVTKYVIPKRLLLWSLPLFALSYMLLAAPQNHIYIYLFLPFLTVFQGITYPNTLSVISNESGPEIQGEVIGINQSVQSLSMTLPPILAGVLLSYDINLPMYIGAGSTIAAWLVYLFYYRR